LIHYGLKENLNSPDSIEKYKDLYSHIFIIGTNVFTVLSIIAFVIEIYKINYKNLLKKKLKPIVSIHFFLKDGQIYNHLKILIYFNIEIHFDAFD
jgi:hypothetical protein